MKTTLVSEARDGKVTITLHMPYVEAAWLLDVVTDSVLYGKLRGVSQEWSEGLMRDLDDHLQRTDRGQDNSFMVVQTDKPTSHRCGDCGFFFSWRGARTECPNCMGV